MEVQAQSPFAHLLTPHSCHPRFRHLRRRFSDADADADLDPADAVPWLEELRVAEFRREVERYDLSIVYASSESLLASYFIFFSPVICTRR
ncbi:hypothetical protein ACMD2_22111 [Ananas comosus]|uniref:Uncharacterized protein n=1 Tax=Ananas comosus TaxID=4615 RepID=A0A199VSF1_ANACO|nr:hypothetical protein ACMD2_22111 [Ananas comosus]